MKNFAYGSIVGASLCNMVHIAANQYSLLHGFCTVLTGAVCCVIVSCVKEN